MPVRRSTDRLRRLKHLGYFEGGEMSGAKSSHSSMTRRSFLKKTGVAAGALGLAGAAGMTTAEGWLAPAEAHAEPEERTSYLCHQFHCLGECALKCTVRDGRIALIEPNDAVDKEDQRICLRGIAEVQHVYSADRIQTPLRRVGERGEGKFEQISWDEAIKEIADAIKESQQKYGEDSFFFRKSTEASSAHGFEFLPQLLHAHSGGKWGLDRGQANGWDPGVGEFSFLPKNSDKDMSKASTIIFWGHNFLESGIVWTKALFDAKEAGAYVVTIDPRFSPTASKSDQWVPIKPGTDAALAFGMTKVILDEGWYDEEYMKSYTGFTFLVDIETGEIVGEMEDSIDPDSGEPIVDEVTGAVHQKKIPLVWDAVSNSVKRHDEEGVAPALEGTFYIDGRKVATEFELTKSHYEKYTASWASSISGVDEQVIYDLAKRYATNGPAIISFGLGGPDKYTNADVLGHAHVVLTAITGNIGREGTGTGWYGAAGATYSADSLQAWVLPEEFGYAEDTTAMYDFPYQDNNIHVAMTFGDAFTLESGNANKMLEWVKGLDFFAICDIYHSSAVDYADVVLPACTKFECEEEVTHVRDAKGYLLLGSKTIDPLFESKTDLQIERLLAAQWGLEHYLPESYEELARHILSKPEGNMEGFTFEALRENQGCMKYLGSETPPQASLVFGTSTTKIEPYYEDQIVNGQQLPTWETPDEAFEENEKRSQYPLTFMQGKSRFRIHAYYSASSWFQEYFGPIVNISPGDALERGIETGDDVEVFNDRGSFIARAAVNDSIQKGTLFMAETTYTRYYKKGFLQNVTNSARQDRCYGMIYGPQIPFNDTLVEMKKA